MKPKEKAKELIDKFYSKIRMPSDCDGCMQCVDKCGNMISIAQGYALILVDEIIKSRPFSPQATENQTQGLYETVSFPFNYWREVKNEIEKL